MKEEETQAKTNRSESIRSLIKWNFKSLRRRTSTKRKILSLVRPDNEKINIMKKFSIFFFYMIAVDEIFDQ